MGLFDSDLLALFGAIGSATTDTLALLCDLGGDVVLWVKADQGAAVLADTGRGILVGADITSNAVLVDAVDPCLADSAAAVFARTGF